MVAAPTTFNNTYYLLRHGLSHANEQDLIVSRPENGQEARWGLSDTGRQQAAAAGQQLAQQLGMHEPASLAVLASPFSRTVDTAVGAGAALGIQEGDPRLQVRYSAQPSACRCAGMLAPAPLAADVGVLDGRATLVHVVICAQARQETACLVLPEVAS